MSFFHLPISNQQVVLNEKHPHRARFIAVIPSFSAYRTSQLFLMKGTGTSLVSGTEGRAKSVRWPTLSALRAQKKICAVCGCHRSGELHFSRSWNFEPGGCHCFEGPTCIPQMNPHNFLVIHGLYRVHTPKWGVVALSLGSCCIEGACGGGGGGVNPSQG